MASITGLQCATGEEWISWPVGTPEPAIAEAAAKFSDSAEAIENITESITAWNDRLVGEGVILAGVWVPAELSGAVAAQWWAGVVTPDAGEEFRSAARFERKVTGRTETDELLIFQQDTARVVLNDTEACAVRELCSAKTDSEPFIRARVVYFPTQTTDRAIVEGIAPATSYSERFTDEIAALASTLQLTITDDNT